MNALGSHNGDLNNLKSFGTNASYFAISTKLDLFSWGNNVIGNAMTIYEFEDDEGSDPTTYASWWLNGTAGREIACCNISRLLTP